MKTENENVLINKAIKQLKIGVLIWEEYFKNKNIEYLNDQAQYCKESKKILCSSLKTIQTNHKVKHPIVQKITASKLKSLSVRTSRLIKENQKGNLKLSENIKQILKASNALINYAIKRDNKSLITSIELTSKAILENGMSSAST